MDLIMNELLLDCLNEAKIVFKHSLTGTIILGDNQQRIFTSLPEYFTMSDYDVHITNSSDIVKDTEQLRALLPEFIKAGTMTPDIIVDAATTKSLSQLKQSIRTAMKKQEAKNDKLNQAMEQIQQLQQQLNDAQKQLQEASTEIKTLNKQKMEIDMQKNKQDAQIRMYQAKTDRDYKQNTAENDNKRTEIELAQVHDGNPFNDKVKQIHT